MVSGTFNCTYAKQIDLVDYLSSLGYQPTKIRNNDHWYLSPLRDEKEPSFKVNRKMNMWYDHGLGIGGDLIDFGKLCHKCSVKELLTKLENQSNGIISFHQQPAGEKKDIHITEGKITVMDNREISSLLLIKYLHERNISLTIANRFCSEVDFDLYRKKHTAIGFKNNSGGYELRNGYFKGSSSPKDITLVSDPRTEGLSVFEGFFNFLSFQAQKFSDKNLLHNLPEMQGNFLVLNSLSFFERSRDLMENHSSIHLYLDRDNSGLKNTKQAIEWSKRYIDESIRYEQYKDLNEYLIGSKEMGLKEGRGLKPRF